MKAQIKLFLPQFNEFYYSDEVEMSENELNQLKVVAEKAVSGDHEYLSFKSENETVVFGKELLKMSVISIIES